MLLRVGLHRQMHQRCRGRCPYSRSVKQSQTPRLCGVGKILPSNGVINQMQVLGVLDGQSLRQPLNRIALAHHRAKSRQGIQPRRCARKSLRLIGPDVGKRAYPIVQRIRRAQIHPGARRNLRHRNGRRVTAPIRGQPDGRIRRAILRADL